MLTHGLYPPCLAITPARDHTLKGDHTMKKAPFQRALPLMLVFLSTLFAPAYAAGTTADPAPKTLQGRGRNHAAPRVASLATKRLPGRQTWPGTDRQPFQGEVWKRTELYFGSGKPDGSAVTESEFQEFVDRAVTP